MAANPQVRMSEQEYLERERADTVINPVLIIEVLSPSTERTIAARAVSHHGISSRAGIRFAGRTAGGNLPQATRA